MTNRQHKHWTAQLSSFVYWVRMDYLTEVVVFLENHGVSRAKLAKRVGVTAGRISQLLNEGGNLTISSAVKIARALGMKAALVIYDDGDCENEKGPILGAIFVKCWERCGKPRDLFCEDWGATSPTEKDKK